MTWAGDKKEMLSKIVDLYQEIESSINRYDASLSLLNQTDFFTDRLIGNDTTIREIIGMDQETKEWFYSYLSQMSELMGEEK